jgi:hypothetical protein
LRQALRRDLEQLASTLAGKRQKPEKNKLEGGRKVSEKVFWGRQLDEINFDRLKK